MSKPFHTLPNKPTIPLTPFNPNHPQSDLDNLKQLLLNRPKIKKTYENSTITKEQDLGVGKEWVDEAVDEWVRLDW